MATEFGTLLREYRKNCFDVDRQRPLTLERLAVLLQDVSGLNYSAAAISAWELGNSQIHKDDRDILVGLIKIFHECGSLHTLEEANLLLLAGHYSSLNEAERHRVNPSWLTIEHHKQEKQDSGTQPADSLQSRQSVPVTGWQRLFGGFLPNQQSSLYLQLFPTTCGDRGINLARQRLLISTAFGTYFAGLLERDNSYINLPGQIDSPAPSGQEQLSPIERIFWALQYPKGPKRLIIAAEGGMGKSTLAAKVIRCLFAEQAIDMILGDSAKTQRVDVLSGEVVSLEPAYYDQVSFYERVCSQLGLPFQRGKTTEKQALTDIRNAVEGRRAIIVIDNLETVTQGDQLSRSLRTIAGRDIRVIITTRTVSGFQELSADTMVVHLRPIHTFNQAQQFLTWHIQHHRDKQPNLQNLEKDLSDEAQMQQLIERTGGIPLLTQLVFSDIARFSWNYLSALPALFGIPLLNFLYQQRWTELGELGEAGSLAKRLLEWIADEQYGGRPISLERLIIWARQTGEIPLLKETLRLLYERFLVVNSDPEQGNFAIFPSLAEFLQRSRQKGEALHGRTI